VLNTRLGRNAEGWTATAKVEFKADLDKVTRVPLGVLRTLADKVAKTYPACNHVELAALEAENSGIEDAEALSVAISAFAYIWENMGGDSPQSIIGDLTSLGLVSEAAGRILTELLVAAAPFRDVAKVASNYLRVGSALFVSIRGTVDIRLRFHNTEDEFAIGKLPTGVVGAQQVIMANLIITAPGDEEKVVSFLMDENDLSYMKRFVRNMEKELELSKGLVKSAGREGDV
jgi:hypothetical protein